MLSCAGVVLASTGKALSAWGFVFVGVGSGAVSRICFIVFRAATFFLGVAADELAFLVECALAEPASTICRTWIRLPSLPLFVVCAWAVRSAMNATLKNNVAATRSAGQRMFRIAAF